MAAARQAACASSPVPKPPSRSTPSIATTPAKPTATPAALPAVRRSSGVRRCAMSTVNSGVVAFRMAAKPLAMWCWPQTKRAKGTALLSSPMPRNAAQSPGARGMRTRSAAQSTSAAMPTRATTMVKEGSSRTATPLKKNDPPHSTDSAKSMAHSTAPIRGSTLPADAPAIRSSPSRRAKGRNRARTAIRPLRPHAGHRRERPLNHRRTGRTDTAKLQTVRKQYRRAQVPTLSASPPRKRGGRLRNRAGMGPRFCGGDMQEIRT